MKISKGTTSYNIHNHRNCIVFFTVLLLTISVKYCPGNLANTFQPSPLNSNFSNDSADDVLNVARQLYSKAVNYSKEKEDSLALKCYLQCYELCDKHPSLSNKKAGLLMAIAKTYKSRGDYLKAIEHYKACETLTSDTGSLSVRIAILNNIGNLYFNLGILDSSESYFRQSLIQYQEQSDSEKIGTIENNLGNIAFQRGDYQKALDYYLSSVKIKERFDDKKDIGLSYSNIASVYEKMDRQEKALDYYQISLTFDSLAHNQEGIASTMVNIGNVCLNNRQNAKALTCFRKACHISEQTNYYPGLANSLEGISLIYCAEENYDSALFYLDKALPYKLKTGNPSEIANIYNSLGALQFYNKQFNKSIQSFKKSIDLASRAGDNEKVKRALSGLHESYAKINDFEKAYSELIQYQIINDSIWNITKSKQIFELQEKYESQKKEQQIKIQQLEIKRKGIERNFALLIAFFVILVAIFSLWLIVIKRKKERLVFEKEKEIKEHQLFNLIQESEIKSSRMMIEGQELEKEHISKELHDRIGGLMSLLKLRFSSLKQFVIEEHQFAFTDSINLLDATYHEVRNFSHELSSDLLSKFGLEMALRELQRIINDSGTISFELEINDHNSTRESFTELALYRIIQELVSNALKHSKASNIRVVVDLNDNGKWNILVEDNGVGFDVEANMTGGLGLMNVEERLSHLHAEMKISSVKNRGTTIKITKE